MIAGYYAVDYQVHSFRSHDGRASIAEHCERAVALGLEEIGFSEHKDFDPCDPVVDYFHYDAYLREVEAARQVWGDRLRIRAGVEIDYQKRFEEAIAAFLETYAFDFVLGSVHYVDGVMIMTPEYNRGRTQQQAYSDYFVAVIDSVRSGLFDAVAHLEYANRRGLAAWGPYDPAAYSDLLEALFEEMIARGVALELNTAGLHQGLGITYPLEATVALYARKGGRHISIGSDAHHPDQLAYAYPRAVEMALQLGFTQVCTWHRRHRIPRRLSIDS
ncbi:MAG TPA: histidinol-phosphatase HisJ family protein [Chthonomonas sp.]|jgi:histidinol-phosphatase (PHP family)|uniref:histidinol-phosphatase HisJ family protein n=1 Tax=Chthonomonas sp. TaxID=2282153 RepID=UPI002B4B5E9F|nr:histidinol-phosphatase HisJ family protein [Chthonomonas sp.]HLH79734.1 histidinol-phosphatase HisJ family protein [Chthonomonas sp.]